jgi:hypothetical protein
MNGLKLLTNRPALLDLRRASCYTFAHTVLESHQVHDTHRTTDLPEPVSNEARHYVRE